MFLCAFIGVGYAVIYFVLCIDALNSYFVYFVFRIVIKQQRENEGRGVFAMYVNFYVSRN